MTNILYFSANPKSPAEGYWDQALVSDILKSGVFKRFPDSKGAIVVIPGPYQGDYIKQINKKLSEFEWVLLLITSDEEGKFPVEKIKHENIRIWIQYPKQGRHDKFGKLPLGYTSDTRKNLIYTKKTLNVFYSGQKSHERRILCSDALREVTKRIDRVFVNDTPGFSQGQEPTRYMANMSNARVAPSPAGPVSADSFRTYEALEAGAAPIADNISLAGDHNYWDYLFGSVPFATINNYEDMLGYVKDQLALFPVRNNNAQAWWIKKKRDLMWLFVRDIEEMSGLRHNERITAIIPVSPIKSHPSTEVLETTVKSIRYHLPDAEILITFDGVREEQEDKRADYDEFIRRALYLCNNDWNAVPILFAEHTHQVGMARVALEEVRTEVILYCEQDTPLVTDEPIEWDKLWPKITMFDANVIRFHFEADIPEPHKHLMLGEPNLSLLKTIQWSQRPHLASTDFYKHMLRTQFSKNAKCFIEDKIHGVIQNDYAEMGFRGWDLWKLFIYYPYQEHGVNIKRSLNLDGRAGEEKYDKTQKF